MKEPTSPIRLTFAAITFAVACCAQARAPLVGEVVQRDGAPLANATVTLVEDDADLVGIDPVDVVEVTTDARGRFTAMALRGVRYTGFAVGPEVGGVAAVCAPVAELACGRPARLLVTRSGTRRTDDVAKLSEWGDITELRVRLRLPNCPGYRVDVEVSPEGIVTMPPLAALAEVEVTTADGALLALLWVPRDPSYAVETPTRATCDVRVVEEDGRPVVGATVSLQRRSSDLSPFAIHCGHHERAAGAVTDGDGIARIVGVPHELPGQRGKDTLVFAASKQGYREGAAGWLHWQPFTDWVAVEELSATQLVITLVKQVEPRVTRASPALAGRRAWLFAMGEVEKRANGMQSTYYLPRRYAVEFAADGAWSVPQLPASAGQLVLQLPPVDGTRVLLLPTRAPELPNAALDTCERLALQLLDATGGPASRASVLLVPHDATRLDFAHAAPLVPDQAGRVDVLLQRGAWTLLAMDETTWAHAELTDWSGDERLELRLADKPSRRVRVLDADGKPVAGAKFEPGAMRLRVPAGPGLPRVLDEMGWNGLGQHVRREVTDARGEATLRFLPWPGGQSVFAWLGDHRTRSDDVLLDDERDDVLDLLLR